MSDTDSFIEEVSEEVRRDRLFALFRKYGWIAILAVLVLVGGTAYREFSISAANTAAQQTGDAVLDALEQDTSEARLEKLTSIDAGTAAPIVGLLSASELVELGRLNEARDTLTALSNETDLSVPMQELSKIKRLILDSGDSPVDERRRSLEQLAASGSAYRTLAEEQLVLIELKTRDRDAAIARLKSLSETANLPSGLSQRVSQLLVMLGQTESNAP